MSSCLVSAPASAFAPVHALQFGWSPNYCAATEGVSRDANTHSPHFKSSGQNPELNAIVEQMNADRSKRTPRANPAMVGAREFILNPPDWPPFDSHSDGYLKPSNHVQVLVTRKTHPLQRHKASGKALLRCSGQSGVSATLQDSLQAKRITLNAQANSS